MNMLRFTCAFAVCLVTPAFADGRPDEATTVLDMRYKLALELVRHTATYAPPVASRTLAYLGVASYEAVASGSDHMQTLAGQLNGFTPPPARATGSFDKRRRLAR